jgi:hypothetical protein
MRPLALFVFVWFVLLLLMPAAGGFGAALDPPRPIRLRSRTFTPPAGVDRAVAEGLGRAARSGAPFVRLILQMRGVPTPATWERLAASGITPVSYVGGDNWIVRMATAKANSTLGEALRAAGATALTPLLPADKASPALLAKKYDDWAYDRSADLLKVVVLFFPDTSETVARDSLRSWHRGAEAPVSVAPLAWAIRIHPSDLGKLLDSEAVHDVEIGPLPKLPLMNDARWNMGVDQTQSINLAASLIYAQGLSGKGVRISTTEVFDGNHDDFWNHDATGMRTTPRWSTSCTPGPNGHGTMTGGIALGNGFLSALRRGSMYQWRGVAPEALMDCGAEDIDSRSFVQTFGAYDLNAQSIDDDVRDNSHRPQIWAIANQGIHSQYGTEVGYYSGYAPAKNAIAVANISASTLRWMYSSIGPTWDGRIKPDLSAPGTKEGFPEDKTQVACDIDFVRLTAPGMPILWSFNGASWQGGWGTAAWWGHEGIGPVTQSNIGTVQAASFQLLPPPYNGWAHGPMIGTASDPAGATLAITGTASDSVDVRYRLERVDIWRPAQGLFGWFVGNVNNYAWHAVSFDLIADGAWHTATVPVGQDPSWKGSAITDVFILFGGAPMKIPAVGGTYGGAGGSSASAPGVAGAVALLMDQMVQKHGIQLGNRTAPSPYWFGAPGNGVPLPSTFKALLIHGAQDLAYIPHADEPDNPDTQQKTVYHDGPDFVTGYGVIDVAASSGVVAAHTAAQPYIVERAMSSGTHTYTITVPPSPRAPLKVTLAWDDKSADPLWDAVTPHLYNDLDLLVIGPDGTHFPYSMDPPYTPTAAGFDYPGDVEPEPINPADIHPARQDQKNVVDNVEQVFVPNPVPGTWTVKVTGTKVYASPQKYSLILRTPPQAATHLSGGKVVFASDRATPGTAQLFVTQVGSGTVTQVTSGPFPAQHPRWSPRGKEIVYVTTDIIVGNSSNNLVDVLTFITATGAPLQRVYALTIGGRSLGYPQWSDDGRRVVVTYWYSWGSRGLALIDLASPYDFATTPAVTVLVPPGSGLNPGEAVFSRDGNFVYFTADGAAPSQLYRIPVTGGVPRQVYGNGIPLRRVFAPSLAPDGMRLAYNSEMWKENPASYQDEEALEVGLLNGMIRRVTAEPGNQYGWFARNGAGEMVVQSNTTPTAKMQLFLEENGARVQLNIADPMNQWTNGSPDWWKPPCGGGTVLWAGGEAVGCKFTTWGPEQKSICGSWIPLFTSGNGSCAVCVDTAWVDPALTGAWSGLTEGPTVTGAVAADLSCRACMTPPASLAAWWTLDETSGTTAADHSVTGAPATYVNGPAPVPGRVKGGLKLNGSAYLEVSHQAPLDISTGSFSIDAWVRIANPADLNGVRVIVEKRQGSPVRGYSFFLYNGLIGVQLADGLGSGQYSNFVGSVGVPADSAWHLVAVTVDRANAQGGQFYLDGVPAGLSFNPTGRQGTLSNARPLRIGSVTLSAFPGSLFKGSLDEVELFRRNLTWWEMQMLYIAGPCGKCK